MSSECKRFNNEENYNFQYYEEYKKLYFTAYCLSIQLKKILKTKDDLCTKLAKIEVFKFVIFRKKHKNNQNNNHANLTQIVRRESEELPRKSNANMNVMLNDAAEIMAHKGRFNST